MVVNRFDNPFKDIKNTFKFNFNSQAQPVSGSEPESKTQSQVSREEDSKPDSFGGRIGSASQQIFSSLKPGINSNENSVKVRPPQPHNLNLVSNSENIGSNISEDIAIYNSGIENESLALVDAANLNYDSSSALGADNGSIYANNGKILAAA
ncbi:MAG: hypothetical protein HRT47_07690 [Candidatus Caenarcaniphilales bacterium]|nr:hypothetical protein [Candidatus Caenarcaniphilales bacterium]